MVSGKLPLNQQNGSKTSSGTGWLGTTEKFENAYRNHPLQGSVAGLRGMRSGVPLLFCPPNWWRENNSASPVHNLALQLFQPLSLKALFGPPSYAPIIVVMCELPSNGLVLKKQLPIYRLHKPKVQMLNQCKPPSQGYLNA